MKVIMAVKKNLLNKIVIEYKTDLINHPYLILLKIQD